MTMDWAKFIFHLIAFAVTIFATMYHTLMVKVGSDRMGGKFKFLTYWNMWFQSIYFGLCLITDLFETKSNPVNPSQRGTLQRWRDNFHSSVAFPTSVFVCVTFWAIYAIDRELVFPKALDRVFPPWLNHLVHTTILPFSIIDKLVCHHHYPKRVNGLLGTALVAVIYLTWVFIVAYVDGFWVYPILEVLSTLNRALFLGICVTIFTSFYYLGESISTYIWGTVPLQKKPNDNMRKKSTKKIH